MELDSSVEYADYLTASIDRVHHDAAHNTSLYEVDIRLGQQHWKVHRTYTEFRRLKRHMIRTLDQPHSDSQCKICRMVLESLQNHPFPRRSMFKQRATVTRSRQRNLNVFVGKLIHYIQMIRQYSNMFTEQTQCSVMVCIHLIEEFLQVEYTRYIVFLESRSILTVY